MMTTEPTTEFIDAVTLADWLREGRVALFDVREEDEFAQARIPGSRLVPLSRFDPTAIAAGPDDRIVLHCRSARRCGLAAEQLRATGDRRPLYRLEGGIIAWVQSGLPVEPG
ncbi:MAG: rhodanese-like domain-containing protein [Thalassobaculum sp.]|uniref:rhodanese-like domain-containing protein n=1 Tax=Thalassobaculum sp. TaxID=2022740 RepID=UPI0032EF50CD